MRAQASFEFMIAFSLLLTIFLIMMTIAFGANINLLQIQDSMVALRNAYAVAAAVNYVYLAGDGASYNLTLTNVMNEENITMSNYSVSSERPHASASVPLLDGKMNASSPGGWNIRITNNKGEIDIGN